MTPEQSVLVVLRRTGALDQGVTVARRLCAAGMTLKQAHHAINQLAATGRAIGVVAATEDPRALAADLAALNVLLRRCPSRSADPADVARLRTAQGLSQREYADLLGLDVRTLRNWEQGRNRPDPAAVNLMRLFAHAPDLVEDVLTEPVTE